MDKRTRDIGLDGAGKGDAPRNISAKFYENFGRINWLTAKEFCRPAGFKLCGPGKMRKTYK